MKKHYFFLSGLFLLACLTADAQILYSNGALVHITSGAIVTANGGVHVSNASAFTNDGNLTITKNSTLPLAGTFDLSALAVVDGNGTYRVEQDWINDATFTAGTSQVELYGNTQQFITSTTGISTTFNKLLLTGTGTGTNRKKTLQGVSASVNTTGTLTINDRELETQANTFFVLNPSPTAVTNSTVPGSEGFVSSASPGTLSRETNSTSAYLFPTGSSNGTLRYRPVEMTPAAPVAGDVYTVRMNNTDPNTDGFNRANNDGSMCVINNFYYHSIDRVSGTTAADIRLFYIASADGNWAGMGHWKNASTDWNNMSTVTPATSGIFTTLNRSSWLFADPGHPYSLINVRPAQPSLTTCPTICENSGGNIFTVTGTATSYQWSVPGGSSIASGQGSSSITVNWGIGNGAVDVYAVGTAGCNSLPASCQPTVFSSPVAQFIASASGNSNYDDNYTFTDISTSGTIWNWSFGDGGSSASQNTSHQYAGAGTYTVVLEVSNAGGCSDTASFVITSDEGINIPNVFSPNGDGINDEFFISSSNLSEYILDIFNRWGELMFHSENKTEVWDGTNHNNGKSCPNGNYFYVLKAASATRDYSSNGYISITGTK
jgi:gliding motility-associated-like protein